jgi:hydrogenase maturation protease
VTATLVIGVGNEDRCDDGAGLAVARRLSLRRLPGVAVRECGGDASELLDAWRGWPSVILVDASSGDAPPGAVQRLDAVKAPLPHSVALSSSHSWGVSEAVEVARALDELPPRIVVYAIEGAAFGLGRGLSPAVETAARGVEARILAELVMGYHGAPREPMPSEFARIPYVRRCVVQRGDRRTEAVACNLSVLGVYVTFLRPLPEAIPAAGETVVVTFLLPDDALPVEAEATVTWQNLEERQDVDGLPSGCGLRFTTLRVDDQRRIELLVQDYLRAPHPRIAAPAPHSGLIRIPYVQPCLLAGGDGTWEGVLCNLSLLGAYVAVDPIPPKGEKVHLLFKVPREEQPLDAQCEVVWENAHEPSGAQSLPPGCGLRFAPMSPAVRERVEDLILEYESIPRDPV